MKKALAAVPPVRSARRCSASAPTRSSPPSRQAYFTDDVLASVGIPAALDGKDGTRQPRMTLETLTSTKPDIMFIARPKDTKTIDQGWETNQLWNTIPAVKNNAVFKVDQNAWSRSRGIDAAELVATQAVKDLYNKTVTP